MVKLKRHWLLINEFIRNVSDRGGGMAALRSVLKRLANRRAKATQ